MTDVFVGDCDNSGGDEEVAEALSCSRLVRHALIRVTREQRIEFGKDRGFVDVLAMQRVEALAAMVGTQHQVVAAGCLADQGDLAEVGSRAAVRAAADAQVDRRILQVVFRQQRFGLDLDLLAAEPQTGGDSAADAEARPRAKSKFWKR